MSEGEHAGTADGVREATGKLPPVAFEIAREAKELGGALEGDGEGEAEDDFR